MIAIFYSYPIDYRQLVWKLRKFLAEIKIDDAPDLASHQWNAGETGFRLQLILDVFWQGEDQGSPWNCRRHWKRICHSSWLWFSRWKQIISIYKGINLIGHWTVNGLAGTLYSISKSGWMEADDFLQWFMKSFVPSVLHLLSKGLVVLFIDGHHSHISLQLVKTEKEKGIHLYCLPLHAAHILQPLNVGVYGPIKQAWKRLWRITKQRHEQQM